MDLEKEMSAQTPGEASTRLEFRQTEGAEIDLWAVDPDDQIRPALKKAGDRDMVRTCVVLSDTISETRAGAVNS